MKILIVKTSALGDIIQTLPLVGCLKAKFPEAQIDWVVEKPFSEMVLAHPQIHRVHTIETKTWRKHLFSSDTWSKLSAFRKALQQTEYDVVFDLQGNLKSSLVTFLARSKHKVGFGRQTVPEWPNLLFTHHKINPPAGQNIRQDYLCIIQSYFEDREVASGCPIALQLSDEEQARVQNVLNDARLEGKPKILVCPGSAWKNKQMVLSNLRDFLMLAQQEFNCVFLLLWGNKEEKQEAEELHSQIPDSIIVDRMPLPLLFTMMSNLDAVIAMDSLPLHLAGMASKPTFSVFGPSLADKYAPQGPQHYAFQGICPYGRTFEKRCPILRTCPTGSCIRSLTGEEVFARFASWYQKCVKDNPEVVLTQIR